MANNSPTRITSSGDHVSSSSSTSADKIRSRFLRKIGIDTPPQSKPPVVLHTGTFGPKCSSEMPPTSFPTNGFPILEPLKIALESDDDDDSSFDSSCENDNYDNSSEGPLNSLSDQCADQSSLDISSSQPSQGSQVEIEYFHKKPHRRGSLHEGDSESKKDTTSSSSTDRATTPPPLRDHSVHSLPSLAASEASSAQLCGSVSSNKKPRFYRNSPPKKKKGVTIHKTVAVVPIPSRLDYSNRIRESMWTTSSELATNATRNTIEFASEGWNWRNVIEDENMLVHQGNGELIHPIHIHNALSCTSQASEEDVKANLNLIASLVPNRPMPINTNTTTNATTTTLTLEKDSDDKDTSDATPSHAIA